MTAFRVAAVAVALLGLTFAFGRLQLVIEGFPAGAPGAGAFTSATEFIPKGVAHMLVNMTGLSAGGVGNPSGSGQYAGLTP